MPLSTFPLPSHRSAPRAAKAAECAARVGKFSEALDAIFANQDSLANSEWPWFFAGLRPKETAEVRQCLADAAAPPLIQAGRDMGTRIGVRGTPTVLLQG